MADIRDLFFFFVHAYIIKAGDKTLLFDTGAVVEPDQLPAFCEENDVDPKEIDYIVISHGHWDHAQLAAAWKELSGAKIICHRNAVNYLSTGIPKQPPYSFSKEAQEFDGFEQFMYDTLPDSIPPAEPDIIVDDEDYDLHELGIPGKLVYTPGHADSAISLVLDERIAFTGDTVVDLHTVGVLENAFEPNTWGLNWICDDRDQIVASVRHLLEEADTFYPGHGRVCTRRDFEPLV